MVEKQKKRPHAKSFAGVKSKAHQSFKAECDINNIMAKFEKTAILTHVNRYQGRYGDFTSTPQSFAEAMQQVTAAREMFQTLPSQLRKRFGNDPGSFVEFVEQADEHQLREVGLLPPVDPAKPVPAGTPQGAVGEPETAPEAPGA